MFFISIKSKWAKSVFFLTLACVSISSLAQVVQTGRLEVPIGHDFETYSVVPLDSSGLALYRSFEGPKENQLELTRLDTALQQVWKGFLPVPKGFSVASAKATNNAIYLFLKSTVPNFQGFLAFVVKTKDGSFFSYPIKNLIQFNATEFVVGEEALLIGGYFNFRPIVLFYSLKEQRSRILPGFLNEPGELTQIKTYPNGNVDVIVSAKNASRKKCLWIRHFDNAGDLIQTVVLEPDENKNLIFGRAAKMKNDNQVIAGVYGKNSQYSRGIFVAEVNVYGEYVIHYYNFADLNNFFHYMKAKREKRIKERIERRKVKGKKIRFNYRFLVHDLVPYGDQFIMLGEAFYPSYSNRSSNFYRTPAFGNYYSPTSYGLYNRYYNSPYRTDYVFDGFQYTHAVAIGFDKQANLIWNNSFEINGIKSFQLEQFVKIFPGQDHIVLLYLYENLIRSKIIKGEQLVEGTTQEAIKIVGGKEAMKHSVLSSKLEHWYGNHFIAHGIQTIRTQDIFFDLRKVFFINKISVR